MRNVNDFFWMLAPVGYRDVMEPLSKVYTIVNLKGFPYDDFKDYFYVYQENVLDMWKCDDVSKVFWASIMWPAYESIRQVITETLYEQGYDDVAEKFEDISPRYNYLDTDFGIEALDNPDRYSSFDELIEAIVEELS